jgi:DinB superfamily
MSDDTALREQLIDLLGSSHAHATFDSAVTDFPPDLMGTRPPGSPHSPWELLEHMRIAQNDILRFSKSANHVSPKFPDGYWPKSPAPKSASAWNESVRAFQEDLAAFATLLRDPARDLYEKFPWGDGQTLLREAFLIADHNAYHLGQLLLLRRLLGAW